MQSALAHDLAELGAQLSFLTEQLTLIRDQRASARAASELAALDALSFELEAAIEDVVAEMERVVAEMDQWARVAILSCGSRLPSPRPARRLLPSTLDPAAGALAAPFATGAGIVTSAVGGTSATSPRPTY
jgi:hypothetical protein